MPQQFAQEFGAEVAKQVFDLAADEIVAQEKATEVEVRIAAAALVEYGVQVQNEFLQAQLQQQKLSTVSDDNLYNSAIQFSKKMVTTYEQFKMLMGKVFDLQNKVNSFLGQEIHMIYTYIDNRGNVQMYRMDNSIEHLNIGRASSSHGGTISGRYRFNKTMLSKMAEVINSEYDSSSLDTTFAEVYERYRQSKARIKQGGIFYVYWRDGSDWEAVRVTSAGVLGETYAAFYLAEYIFASMIEAAVGDFMTNPKYGATSADNMSGFLEGDISSGNNQFGIKAKGATALGYIDVLNYAKEMLTAPDLYAYLTGDNGGLKQRLRDAAVHNLAQQLPKHIGGTLDDLFDELEKLGKK